MKNKIQKAVIVLGVALTAFTACKKDALTTVTTADETTLATQALTAMDNVGVYTDENNANIYMDNEGIAADFQVDGADCDLVQGPAGGGADDSIRAKVRNMSFVRCLNGLNLSDGQRDTIKRMTRGYAECKAAAVKRARQIYAELQAVYKAKAEKLVKAYKDSLITKAQLENGLKELRESFHKELRSKHLAERLDDAMKACFFEYLKKLHSVLTEAQWKAFVACYRH